jgi:hypothetical protein
MVLTPVPKLVASLFRFPTSGRIRDRAQQRFGRALVPLRELIEDIEDAVIPAPLLLGFRIHVAHGIPNAQMPVAEDQARGPQPAIAEIAQHFRPADRGFPVLRG